MDVRGHPTLNLDANKSKGTVLLLFFYTFWYTMYEYFNNYVITKCPLSCDVLLMLIGSRHYTVLYYIHFLINL
jgi:hypothetical protein